jgi:predicted pyridoxine 5'-phosphate oxidase superfamily flavin-nucleotide-binding protein
MVEITEELKRLIEENALAFATVDESGKPHNIAVGDVKVVSKNQILIGDNYMVETIKNIQRSNNVALAVWSRNWEERCVGYELRGIAEYITQGKWHNWLRRFIKDFLQKGQSL